MGSYACTNSQPCGSTTVISKLTATCSDGSNPVLSGSTYSAPSVGSVNTKTYNNAEKPLIACSTFISNVNVQLSCASGSMSCNLCDITGQTQVNNNI